VLGIFATDLTLRRLFPDPRSLNPISLATAVTHRRQELGIMIGLNDISAKRTHGTFMP
jgi:hypothetical protein